MRFWKFNGGGGGGVVCQSSCQRVCTTYSLTVVFFLSWFLCVWPRRWWWPAPPASCCCSTVTRSVPSALTPSFCLPTPNLLIFQTKSFLSAAISSPRGLFGPPQISLVPQVSGQVETNSLVWIPTSIGWKGLIIGLGQHCERRRRRRKGFKHSHQKFIFNPGIQVPIIRGGGALRGWGEVTLGCHMSWESRDM